jgi:hypothetical protein
MPFREEMPMRPNRTLLSVVATLTLFTAEASAQNVVAWFAPSASKVMRDAAPSEQPREWSLAAARNEVEACQLVLATDQLVRSVAVSVSPLEGPDGKGRLEPELYKVEYVPVKKEKVPYPDPLPPLTGAFDLRPHETQPVWILVRVPKDARPGEYRGIVKVRAGSQTQEFPLTVKVWDFALPDAPTCVTAFGYGPKELIADWHGVKPDSPESSALFRKYYEFHLAHRISPYTIPVDLMSDEAAAYLDDPRMTSYMMPYDAESDAKLKALVDRLKQGGHFAKGYFYVVDEPVSRESFDRLVAVAERLRRIEPRYRLVAPFWSNPSFGDRLATGDVLAGKVNVWCPHLLYVDSQPGFRAFLNDRRKAGDSIWWYVCNNPRDPHNNLHIDMNAMSHRTLLWQQKREGIDGLLYWDTTYWDRKFIRDPWQEMDTIGTGFYGDGALLYPGRKVGVDGPVSSLRFEVLRDSLEDFDYFALADRLLGPAVTKGYVVKIARTPTDYERDPAKLETIRRELGAAIEKAARSPSTLLP